MKESISYTFLLNIIILFLFVCVAVIMGILSYYRAYRANAIISETIEKYEGYNCLAKDEIARKLPGIGYTTPFKVTCKASDKNCEAAENLGYKVISYNLDFDTQNTDMKADATTAGTSLIYGEKMNSAYKCDTNGCTTNKYYQYGIYTYMYAELPVISKLIRIPLFAKTSVMYEYRNFYVTHDSDKTQISDVESVFYNLYERNVVNGKTYIKEAYLGDPAERSSQKMFKILLSTYSTLSTGGVYSPEYIFMDITKESHVNYRTRAMIKGLFAGRNAGLVASGVLNYGYNNGNTMRRTCGYSPDYSLIN